MLQRALSGLQDPGSFFRWLGSEPPRPGVAFLVPLLAVLVSTGASVSLLLLESPQTRQLRRLLDESGLSVQAFGWMLLLAAPVGALVVWATTWVPIRLGAGPGARLWEVAAWSQLPQLAIAPLQAVVGLTHAPDLVSITLSILGLLWSTWFVYAGVLELARGRALGAAVVHALAWSLPVVAAIATSRSATPDTMVF
jgi:hypothetical protein